MSRTKGRNLKRSPLCRSSRIWGRNSGDRCDGVNHPDQERLSATVPLTAQGLMAPLAWEVTAVLETKRKQMWDPEGRKIMGLIGVKYIWIYSV